MVVPKKDAHNRCQRCKQGVIGFGFILLILLIVLPQPERLEMKEVTNELKLLDSKSTVESSLITPAKMTNNNVPMETSSIQQQGDESIQVEEGQGWRKTLPLANNFTATTDTQYEVCFVTSVYSSSFQQADRPPTVQPIQDQNPSFRFFAFTNLPNLEAPGWKLRFKPLDQYYKRRITQSRWAKFMAWEDPEILLVSG